jgi:flagellar motor switch protein FliG
VLALAGSAPDVVEPLLDHLPHDEALRITDGLANLGSVRLSDIDHAQDDLAHLVSQMDTEGRLPDWHRSHLTAVV